ncbi:MAG: LptA/OstA family protein [Candidatus Aminicenantales bacterium]
MRTIRQSSKSKRRAKTAVRVVLILLLVALLGAVIVFLIRRSGRPAVIRSEARAISEQKVDVTEDIHVARITGGKNILDAWASRRFVDTEGLYHLSGRVDDPNSRARVEIRGRDDGRLKYKITAAEVVYDVDMTHLVFRGGVDVRMEDIEIKGSAFDYKQAKNIITSDAPVSFTGARFRGECRRARYDMDKQKIFFFDGITLVINPWANDPKPLVITGETLSFERSSRIGEIASNVRMTHGRSFGRTDSLQFAQFTDKPGFRLFEFRGRVRIDADERPIDRPAAPAAAAPPEKPPVADEGLIFLQGGRQRLEAGEVSLLPYGDQDWLHLIAVRNGGKLEILDDGGKQTTIEAGDMKFYYNEEGSLRDFMLTEGARIQGEADGRSRLVEAPKIDFNSNAGNIVAIGNGENRARTISAGREITAENMIINLRTNDFKITGGVKIVSLPQKEEVREAALFDSGQTMFMTAATSTYEAAKRRFALAGRARLWQGRNSLEGDNVTILEDTGEMTAAGAVRSVFFQRPKGKTVDERIEITGDELARDSKTKQIIYTGTCTLTVSGIIMTAGRLTLEPDKEAGRYRRIYGDLKRVVIIQGANKAEGDEADYDLVEDVIVLTGRPVLDQKNKGVIQCGKLTFYPADGKILIEKQSAERSATIIKS